MANPDCDKCGGKGEGALRVMVSQPLGVRSVNGHACADCAVGHFDEAVRRGEPFSVVVTPQPEEPPLTPMEAGSRGEG